MNIVRYLALAVAALAVLQAVPSGRPAGGDVKAIDALIVRVGALPKDGVSKVSAVVVADAEKLAALEAFFPGYAKRPTSDVAGGWIAGHRVYFNFPGGATVRVTVSANANGRSWSTGQGDFATNGDFVGFVERLVP